MDLLPESHKILNAKLYYPCNYFELQIIVFNLSILKSQISVKLASFSSLKDDKWIFSSLRDAKGVSHPATAIF